MESIREALLLSGALKGMNYKVPCSESIFAEARRLGARSRKYRQLAFRTRQIIRSRRAHYEGKEVCRQLGSSAD